MFGKLLVLCVCGAAGTLGRHLLSSWTQQRIPITYPVGTLAVNALGCFLFGLVWSLTENRVGGAATLRLYALTGFMGAFTTFSTFASESVRMLAARDHLALAIHWTAHNVGGCLLVVIGLALGQRLLAD